ncbi:MAG: class I SAM-dependent methyltransferase [Halobacteriales archaeon]
MPDVPDRPIARRAYERLAAGYDREGDTKPENAYLERPATLSLVPDVDGARVLDAGCGAGHLAVELNARGAAVVGLDASRAMLECARERVPDADFVRGDLESDLPFGEGALGGVASSLAFDYVADWERLFRDLRRVLGPGGWAVFSVQHPHADFERYDDARNYHERERVSETWNAFGETVEVPSYRRPLAAMVNPPLEAGFRLDRVLEPTPTEEYRAANPEQYRHEMTHPRFLCLRFVAAG